MTPTSGEQEIELGERCWLAMALQRQPALCCKWCSNFGPLMSVEGLGVCLTCKDGQKGCLVLLSLGPESSMTEGIPARAVETPLESLFRNYRVYSRLLVHFSLFVSPSTEAPENLAQGSQRS